MKTYKATTLLFALLAMAIAPAFAQQEFSQDLRSFNKIIASPRVNVILQEGTQESVRLVYDRITSDKINVEVRNKTLYLYLDNAKVLDKLTHSRRHHNRISVYENVSVTAYITYKELRHLEIRGAQELTCKSPLKARKFTLKAYGENEINLASLDTEYLKTSLYGENELKIKTGMAEFQKYRLFGENKIDTQGLRSFNTTTNIYGESKIKLSTQDELRINSFGEAKIYYNGNAEVSKGLVFGRTSITQNQ